MKHTGFLIKSREYFPIRNWHWMIAALQQDPVIFNELTQTSLGQEAIDSLRAVPEDWTPASLSLFALGNPVQLGEIKNLPLLPLPSNLRQNIKVAYTKWYQNPETLTSIKDAGLVALSLRERLRITGSWDGFIEEYDGKLGHSQTVIACLYGMIPDSQELIEVLVSTKPKYLFSNLIAHAILCSPLPQEAQFEIYKTLIAGEELEFILDFLYQLENKRPALTKALANEIIKQVQFESYTNSGHEVSISSENSDRCFIEHQISKLTRLLRYATLRGFSEDPKGEHPELSDSIEIAKKINAGLQEKLALAISRENDLRNSTEQRLRIWKIAVQNDPDNPSYIVGLSDTLVESGRLKDARAYLETSLTDHEKPLDPLLFLAVAKIAFKQGDFSSAEEYALNAYTKIASSNYFYGEEFFSLAEILIANDYYHEAIEVIEFGLSRFNHHPDLLSLLAYIKQHIGEIDESLQTSYLALAFHGINLNSENQFEFNTEIRKRIIENLSFLKYWESALHERISLAELKGSSVAEDYHEIADLALNADQPEQTLNFCKLALKLNSMDGKAYYLMGKADLAMNDYSSAIENLNKAVQYKPESTKTWLTLADAYKGVGDESRFVDTLNEAVHAVPEDPEIQFALGKAYLARNLPSRALEFFNQAIAFLPDNSSSADLNQQESLFIHEQNFLKNPGLSFEISYFLGDTLSKLGYKDDAMSAFKRAYEYALNSEKLEVSNLIESGQGIKEKIFLIAKCYAHNLIEINDFEKVIQVLGFASRYGSLDTQANLDLARALLMAQPSQSNAEKAVELLEKTFFLSPEKSNKNAAESGEIDHHKQAEAQAIFAEALALSGDIERAKEAFRYALDTPLAENSIWKARLSTGLGRIALLINEPELALASLHEAEKIQKGDVNIYRLLAEAYLETGLLPESYSAAMTAVKLNSSDNPTLDWFSSLVMKIINQKENYDPKMLSECIQVIEKSILENSKQSNLLLRLIQLELVGGNQQKAFETIDALTISGFGEAEVDAELILEVASELRNGNTAEYAIKLLQITIDHLLSIEPEQTHIREELVSKLYYELSSCHMENGDKVNAVQTLEQAVKFDPENVDIYRKSIIILRGAGKYEAAELLIQEGINKFPEDIRLNQYAAELFFSAGKYNKALDYCDSALNIADEELDISRKNRIAILAAEITRSILLTDRAYEYLNLCQPESEDSDLKFMEACIRTELAMVNENPEDAKRSIEAARNIQPEHSLVKILSARIKARKDIYDAQNFLEMERIEIQKHQIDYEALIPGVGVLSNSFIHRSFGTALLELNNWDAAIEQLTNAIKEFKHDPLSHILLAKSIVGQAEEQRLKQYLDIKPNTPGESALDENASSQFENIISSLEGFYEGMSNPQESDELPLEQKDCCQSILLLKCRGKLAFQPSLDLLNQYNELLFARSFSSEDLFVYLLALCQFTDQWTVQARDQLFQELRTKFGDTIDNAKILFILGLLFSEQDPLTALDYLLKSEDLFINGAPNLPVRLPMIKYLIAKLALKVREYTTAVEAILGALEFCPDEPSWCEFASTIFQIDEVGNGFPDLEKAASLLKHAIEIEPNEISRYEKLGDIYSRLGEYSSAEKYLKQALNKEPENGEIWFSLAEIQLQSGNLDGAAASAAKSIENSVDGLKPLLLRGEINLQRNNPKGAYQIAQELLEQFPNHEQAILMLSRALVLLGRSQESLDLLKTAVAHVKEPLLVQLEYIRLLANLKGFDAALHKLKEIYRTNPGNPHVMLTAAEILNNAGKNEQSVEIAIKALKIGNNELSQIEKASLHYLIGHKYHQEGQLDQAVHHLKASEQLDPKNINSYLELGQVFHERRQYKEALNLYRKSIDLAPDNYYPYYLAGLLLKDQKDYSQAESVLRKASKLEPDNAQVNRLLNAVTALDLVHSQKLTHSHISAPTN